MWKNIAPLMILLTAACGGGGAGGSDPLTPGQERDLANQVIKDITQSDYTDPASLPNSRVARYGGHMNLRMNTMPGAPTTYLGDLALAVDFGATSNQITGTARDFRAPSGNLRGQLALSSGDLTRSTDPKIDFTYGGLIGGTLTAGDNTTYTLDGDFAGDLHGRNGGAVSGVIFGDVTGPNGIDLFDGAFAGTLKP